MKDKKNIIIAVLSGIIILGVGYTLGTKNSNKETADTSSMTTFSTRHEYSSTSTTSSNGSDSTSFHDVEKTEITSDSLITVQELTDEEIAFDKMVSLQGTWAVWQSDNNFTIHPDGTWTNRPAGPGGDRIMNVEAIDYDESTNTLNVSIDNDLTQIHIQNEKELFIEFGKDGSSSKFILIE